jgi:hypothetical protein
MDKGITRYARDRSGAATTNAKLHVSNQKATGMLLKQQHLDGRFQLLPLGEGVHCTWDGFWVPNLKGGITT